MLFLRKFYRFYELTLIYCFLYFDLYNFTSTFHSYNYFDLNKLVMPNNRLGEHNLISNKFISNFFNVEGVNQFREINATYLFDGDFLCYFVIYTDPKNLTSFQPFESNVITKESMSFVKVEFLNHLFFYGFSIFKVNMLIGFLLMAGMIAFSDQQRKMIEYNSAFKPKSKIELAFSLWLKLFFSLLKYCFFKIKVKKKSNFLCLHYFFMLALICFSFTEKAPRNVIEDKLISSSKINFFTIEIINMTNQINSNELQNYFCLFTISLLKYRRSSNYLHLLLILSGDVSLNPVPPQIVLDDNFDIWSPFKKRGLHFVHLNVNSLFTKIDEMRYIAK